MTNPVSILLGILGAIALATLICAIWNLISRDIARKILATVILLIICIVVRRDMQQGE